MKNYTDQGKCLAEVVYANPPRYSGNLVVSCVGDQILEKKKLFSPSLLFFRIKPISLLSSKIFCFIALFLKHFGTCYIVTTDTDHEGGGGSRKCPYYRSCFLS